MDGKRLIVCGAVGTYRVIAPRSLEIHIFFDGEMRLARPSSDSVVLSSTLVDFCVITPYYAIESFLIDYCFMLKFKNEEHL